MKSLSKFFGPQGLHSYVSREMTFSVMANKQNPQAWHAVDFWDTTIVFWVYKTKILKKSYTKVSNDLSELWLLWTVYSNEMRVSTIILLV